MAEIINLNKARKARDKAAAKSRAHINRTAHGRTGAEKKAAKLENKRTERRLDGARLDPDRPPSSD